MKKPKLSTSLFVLWSLFPAISHADELRPNLTCKLRPAPQLSQSVAFSGVKHHVTINASMKIDPASRLICSKINYVVKDANAPKWKHTLEASYAISIDKSARIAFVTEGVSTDLIQSENWIAYTKNISSPSIDGVNYSITVWAILVRGGTGTSELVKLNDPKVYDSISNFSVIKLVKGSALLVKLGKIHIKDVQLHTDGIAYIEPSSRH
jgi:hypothetical protein